MLLAADIGNTKTALAIFRDGTIAARAQFPTDYQNNPPALSAQILQFLQTASINPATISGGIFASVVPSASAVFQTIFRQIFNFDALAANYQSDFKFSRIDYEEPEKLGIDRLIAAFAAREKYGAPCIVGDFGTATTIDAVDENNVFRGGIIAPGMKMFADTLHRNTAQLPKTEFVKPPHIFGTNTIKSIQSAVWFGYPKMIDALIRTMAEKLGGNPPVIAAGGLAEIIAAESALIEIVEPDLILEGLGKLGMKDEG